MLSLRSRSYRSAYCHLNFGQRIRRHTDLRAIGAQAEFRQAEISPDGTYLAVDVVHEGRRALAVLKTEDLEVIKVSGFTMLVGGFGWINNDRLVLTIVRKRYGREAPGSFGEIYAVNADGSAPSTFMASTQMSRRSPMAMCWARLMIGTF